MSPESCRPSATPRTLASLAPVLALPLLMACVMLSGCRRAETPAAAPARAPAPAAQPANAAEVTGTYTLESIDGNALPYTLTHEGPGVTVTAAMFTIKADGTCSSNVTFVMPGGASSSREVGATYTREGGKLTMQWQGAGQTVGTVEGQTLTHENEGIRWTYRKAP